LMFDAVEAVTSGMPPTMLAAALRPPLPTFQAAPPRQTGKQHPNNGAELGK